MNSWRHFRHFHLYENVGHKKRPITVSAMIRVQFPAVCTRRTSSEWHSAHLGLTNRNDPFDLLMISGDTDIGGHTTHFSAFGFRPGFLRNMVSVPDFPGGWTRTTTGWAGNPPAT